MNKHLPNMRHGPLYECFNCHNTWSGSEASEASGGYEVCPRCLSENIERYDERYRR